MPRPAQITSRQTSNNHNQFIANMADSHDFSGFGNSLADIQDWLLEDMSVDRSMEVDQLTSTATNGALLTQLDDIGNVSMVSAPNQDGSQDEPPLASTANTGLLIMNLNELDIPETEVGLSMDTWDFSWITENSDYSLEPYSDPELMSFNSTTSTDTSFETDHLNALEGGDMSDDLLSTSPELFDIILGNENEEEHTMFSVGSTKKGQ